MSFLWSIFISGLILTLGLPSEAEELDIRGDSQLCQTKKLQNPQLNQIVEPAWRAQNSTQRSTGTRQEIPTRWSQSLTSMQTFAHGLNGYYLQNMSSPIYRRWAAMIEAGLPLDSAVRRLQDLQLRCENQDGAKLNLKREAQALLQIPADVQQDYRDFHLQPQGFASYSRLMIVAGLESARIKTVIGFLTKKIEDPRLPIEDRDRAKQSLLQHSRRLIRLHFAYPYLANQGGPQDGGKVEDLLVQAFVNYHLGLHQRGAYFFSPPELEETLKLAPPGVQAFDLGPTPLAPPISDLHARQFYQNLYAALVAGTEPVPRDVLNILKAALQTSLEQALMSAELKCQNQTPCLALSVDPSLSGRLIAQAPQKEGLEDIACACQIQTQRATFSDQFNLGLGFAASAVVITWGIFPEQIPFEIAGWLLSIADMGAASAGIFDGIENMQRAKKDALLRTGGTSDFLNENETATEVNSAHFNLMYNWATGVIGLWPPARPSSEFAQLPFRALITNRHFLSNSTIELVKGASGIPAPKLEAQTYSESWNPRLILAPLPDSFQDHYPRLAQNLSLTLRS